MQWYLNFLEKGGNRTPYYLWYRQHDFSKKLSTDAKFLTFEIEGKQGVIQEAVNGGKNTITIELPKANAARQRDAEVPHSLRAQR